MSKQNGNKGRRFDRALQGRGRPSFTDERAQAAAEAVRRRAAPRAFTLPGLQFSYKPLRLCRARFAPPYPWSSLLNGNIQKSGSFVSSSPLRSRRARRRGARQATVHGHERAGSTRHLSDPAGDPVCGRLDGIVGEMGVAGGGLHLGVPEQFADHGQAFAYQETAAGEGVTQIVDADGDANRGCGYRRARRGNGCAARGAADR